ncbi:hypothetical protein H6P81_003279 [Aristolochia fimbriata]|uniref:Protein SLOW GREEN 1, chloroplastic n=1 Tax=Aristolochia fimbriata TaxID=158543 RepID=A0AAV7FFC4_ARIFI|nr:hypothetical protein H6P81_003279 [Aristolochia fimbriata]
MDSLLPRVVVCSHRPKLRNSSTVEDKFHLNRAPQRSPLPRFRFLQERTLFTPPSFQLLKKACKQQTLRCFSSLTSLTGTVAKARSDTDTQHFVRNAEKLAIALVCSLLFLGGFAARPALASVNAPTSTSSSEEKREEDEIGKGGDEEDLYLKILEKNPKDVEALKVVLYGKMRKGKTKEAVQYVERLIDIQPDEVEWRLLQALSYELMGHLSKAKRLFKEILEEWPLLLRALHGLALVMHKNHEGAAVFEMLNEALELSRREKRVTEERNIKILIAQMHVVKGDLEEGLKRYQDLVNENPRDFRPYLCQGIIYSLLNKTVEAEEQFENYRSLVPQEFPQRGFLDDVILTAKTESMENLQKEFDSEFSYKKRCSVIETCTEPVRIRVNQTYSSVQVQPVDPCYKSLNRNKSLSKGAFAITVYTRSAPAEEEGCCSNDVTIRIIRDDARKIRKLALFSHQYLLLPNTNSSLCTSHRPFSKPTWLNPCGGEEPGIHIEYLYYRFGTVTPPRNQPVPVQAPFLTMRSTHNQGYYTQ